MALQPFVGPWPLFSFLILYTVGRTPLSGDQPVVGPLPIHKTTQIPTTPVFERENTVYALDRAATVIGPSAAMSTTNPMWTALELKAA
jgi:hypothetical protein